MTDPSELRMNVAALKRVDPYVKDILETATHVALYLFISEANEWEKTEIEGALFIYSRIGEPYNSFLIMNRLSTSNQVEPVTAALEIQCQEPFLLYKNGKGMIYGIWFYDKDECIRVASMLTKLAKELSRETPNKSTPKIKKQQVVQKKSNNVDIFSMLSKAQEDFNSNKSNSVSKVSRSTAEPKSPMSSAIGDLAGALSSMAPDVTSKSVMDFFAKAKVSNTSHYVAGDHQAPVNVVNEGKPLLQRLMSHPAAHTVEHIEKQQRSTTPQPAPSQPGIIPVNNQSCENSMLSKLQKCKVSSQNAKISGNSFNQEYAKLNTSAGSGGISHSEISSIPADESNTSGFLRIQSPTANSSKMFNQNKNPSKYNNAFDKFFRTSPVTLVDNVYRHNSTACEDLIPPLTPKSSIPGNDTAPALIPPGMFLVPSPAAETLNGPIEPLTRNQLLQAFNYLLRTDPEFVNKLHEAYVKSFSEILS